MPGTPLWAAIGRVRAAPDGLEPVTMNARARRGAAATPPRTHGSRMSMRRRSRASPTAQCARGVSTTMGATGGARSPEARRANVLGRPRRSGPCRRAVRSMPMSSQRCRSTAGCAGPLRAARCGRMRQARTERHRRCRRPSRSSAKPRPASIRVDVQGSAPNGPGLRQPEVPAQCRVELANVHRSISPRQSTVPDRPQDRDRILPHRRAPVRPNLTSLCLFNLPRPGLNHK